MTRFFIFCLFFLGLTSMTNSEELSSLRLTKSSGHTPRALAPQDTLKNVFMADTDFFSVDIKFQRGYYDRVNSYEVNQGHPMVIIISSNETAFNWDCFYDQTYHCDEPACLEVPDSEKTLQFPLITVNNATKLTLNTNTRLILSIANEAWKLNNDNNPLLFKECAKNDEFDEYFIKKDETFGWIGLGTEGGASKNFQTANPIFSVHLNASASTGELVFGFDAGRTTDYVNPIITIGSDEQWRFQISSISNGDFNYHPSTPLTAVFDLNYEGIVLPKDIYNTLRRRWSQVSGVAGCDTDSKPCYYNGKNLKALSDLILTLPTGQKLTIPTDYFWVNVSQVDDNMKFYFSLKMDGVISNITTKYIIGNHIVFGWRVMSHFYSLFNKTSTGNAITLYDPVPESPYAVYIPITPPPPVKTNPKEDETTGINPGDTSSGSPKDEEHTETNPGDTSSGSPKEDEPTGTNPDDTSSGSPKEDEHAETNPGDNSSNLPKEDEPTKTNPSDTSGDSDASNNNNGGYIGYYIGGIVGVVIVVIVVVFYRKNRSKREISLKENQLTTELSANPEELSIQEALASCVKI